MLKFTGFTGHKSVQSLQMYRHVSKERKMEMSEELTKVINKMKEQVQQEEKYKQLPTKLPNNATPMAKNFDQPVALHTPSQ